MSALSYIARMTGIAASAVALTSCASIASSPTGDQGQRGLVYHMPINPVILTLTVDAQGGRTLSVEALTAVADTTSNYYLRHSASQAASQLSEITVGPSGLLTGESSGDTSSATKTIIQSFGKAAATIRSVGLDGERSQPNRCASAGTYTWRLYPGKKVPGDEGYIQCGLKVEVRFLGKATNPDDEPASIDYKKRNGERDYGIFYRQRLPIEVFVTSDSILNLGISSSKPLPSIRP
jgi:hypothetical protein